MDRWMLLPVELFVVATIASEDAYWLERVLHAHYADKRVRGEWFRLDDFDLRALQSVKRIDGPEALPSTFAPLKVLHSKGAKGAWLLTPAEQAIVNRAAKAKRFNYVQAFRSVVRTMLAKCPSGGFPKPLLVLAKERALAMAREKLRE